jgi:anti-sigma factor RsiW
MMDCELINKLLPNYLDDELTEELAQRINAHLIQCKSCAWEVESIRQAVLALQQSSLSAQPSAQFRAKLLNNLIRENRAAAAKQPQKVGQPRKTEPTPMFVLDLDKEEIANG